MTTELQQQHLYSETYFQSLFNNETLSDIKLKVGDNVYHAHKVILSLASQTFRTMFTSGFSECDSDTVELENAEEFELVLQYIYGLKYEIKPENALALYQLASFYQVLLLKQECEKTLEKWLTLDTICYIYAAAEQNDSQNLAKKVLARMTCMHLPLLLKAPGFLDLPTQAFTRYIATDTLLGDESYVYEAAKAWVLNHIQIVDASERESVLSLVRYDLIASRDLKIIREQLTDYPSIIERIDEALKTEVEETGCRGVLGDYAFPAESALAILNAGCSRGNGMYWIMVGERKTKVYCDMEFEGGGWMLVRRCKPSGAWADNPSDKLAGQTEYNYEYDQDCTPVDDRSFGVQFDVIPYSHFLFRTGDESKWLICKRSSVHDEWHGIVPVDIEKSYEFDTPYQAEWCKRNGVPEDPWISSKDHLYNGYSYHTDDDNHSMLYGCHMQGAWAAHANNNQGCNVWIR